MVRRGWRDLLYLGYATAEAKVKRFLHLGKAAPSGTIENVGGELPPELKRKIKIAAQYQQRNIENLHRLVESQNETSSIVRYITANRL